MNSRFALSDELAPVVFINRADTKAARCSRLRMSWRTCGPGKPRFPIPRLRSFRRTHVERWCNQVAAELLVPLGVLQAEFDREASSG
jgi:Zn-dependent peptidase ImmA (M78 family)